MLVANLPTCEPLLILSHTMNAFFNDGHAPSFDQGDPEKKRDLNRQPIEKYRAFGAVVAEWKATLRKIEEGHHTVQSRCNQGHGRVAQPAQNEGSTAKVPISMQDKDLRKREITCTLYCFRIGTSFCRRRGEEPCRTPPENTGRWSTSTFHGALEEACKEGSDCACQ